MVAILMTQRAMDSPSAPAFFSNFRTLVYQAIEDKRKKICSTVAHLSILRRVVRHE
jgi:hypothetical protein